jgi:hypothetical protein
MTMKVECYFCGDDCSTAHATWHGYPCHIMCIPAKPKKTVSEVATPQPMRTGGVPVFARVNGTEI